MNKQALFDNWIKDKHDCVGRHAVIKHDLITDHGTMNGKGKTNTVNTDKWTNQEVKYVA